MPTSLAPASSAAAVSARQEDDFSLSDEDMLLCDDEDAWSEAAAAEARNGKLATAASATASVAAASNGRSRRLLSLEQSKVLYNILDKVSFAAVSAGGGGEGETSWRLRVKQAWRLVGFVALLSFFFHCERFSWWMER